MLFPAAQGALVGFSTSGLVSLTVWGFGLLDYIGNILQKADKWSKEVKSSLVLTFAYSAGMCIPFGLSVATVCRSPSIFYLLTCRPTVTLTALFPAAIISGTALMLVDDAWLIL